MMIEIAKGNGVSRFLFASSCSVYGATDLLMDEQSDVTPISLYAQTKVDSERVLLKSRTPHFHPTVLRLATVFGNSYRPRFDLVVNLLVARAYQDGVITIFNSGQWRPFIHAGDVAAGFLRVLQAPIESVSGEVFNLGDTTMNHTLAGLAEQIREAFPGTRVELVENADRRNYRVSFAKIERAIGFRCAVTLADGIAELKAAFDSGRIPNYSDVRYHNQKFLRTAGSPISKDTTDARVMAAFAFDEGAR
jgi:nucleoside-diphosphate-sugar epimerase